MRLSRRDFLKLCTASSAALALSPLDLLRIEEAMASPDGPSVLWLQGAACTGCSVSFLNRISPTAPVDAADVLINTVNLAYHPNLMAAAGDSAVAALRQAAVPGKYILAVEGGVPTAFGGAACLAFTENGRDVPFQEAVTSLAAQAWKILCVGTCASWGGIPAAAPNPTAIRGVRAVTGKTTVNIGGCPPHPDWIVWTIAKLLAGTLGSLDSYGRPRALFGGATVHDRCPRREREEAETYGVDRECLEELGCLGPDTRANCPSTLWNGGRNWCVDANAQCIGCTESTFPRRSLRRAAHAGH